jgi:hypothetical protein
MAEESQQPEVKRQLPPNLVPEDKEKAEEARHAFGSVTNGSELLEWSERFGAKPAMSPAVVTRRLAEIAGIYPLPNLAVDSCIQQWETTITQQRAKGVPLAEAAKAGKAAFCCHLPKISSRDEVSEFIACVAYGMANGIIPGQEGTRLLYAAQVAHSTLPSPKRRKTVRKTSQKQPSEPTPTPTETTT